MATSPAPSILRAGLLALLLLVSGAPSGLVAQESRSLFDGQSLTGWAITDFVGHGLVEVRQGTIFLGRGDPMTGITWTKDFPRVNYEVTLEAMRIAGEDFFSAITFPVEDDPCTLVLGGWGGGVVGLSSIAGADASENETSRWMRFEDDRWYGIRLRVTDEKIEAWIDDEKVVDFTHTDRLLSIRVEVLLNRPFGIATWKTTAGLRNIVLRRLPETPRAS